MDLAVDGPEKLSEFVTILKESFLDKTGKDLPVVFSETATFNISRVDKKPGVDVGVTFSTEEEVKNRSVPPATRVFSRKDILPPKTASGTAARAQPPPSCLPTRHHIILSRPTPPHYIASNLTHIAGPPLLRRLVHRCTPCPARATSRQ